MANYADTSLYTEEENTFWNVLLQNQDQQYFTMKKLAFTYSIKGNELFISRKRKSITRAAVNRTYHKAKEVMNAEGAISGPKKIGTFGASYLLPIFVQLNIV